MDSLFSFVIVLLAIVVLGGLVLLVVLMIRDTIRQRGALGINLSVSNCRHCGSQPPAVRVPATFREAMIGGWTCPECGLQLDKWGVPIPGQTELAKWKVNLDPNKPPRQSTNARLKSPNDNTKRRGDIRD